MTKTQQELEQLYPTSMESVTVKGGVVTYRRQEFNQEALKQSLNKFHVNPEHRFQRIEDDVRMTGYPISALIMKGIDLDTFDTNDWSYDVHFDVVYVRENTVMWTFLALAMT
jgi:hypothetical protein